MKGVMKGVRKEGGRKVEGQKVCVGGLQQGEGVRNRLCEGKEKRESVESEDKNKRRNIHNVTCISHERVFF